MIGSQRTIGVVLPDGRIVEDITDTVASVQESEPQIIIPAFSGTGNNFIFVLFFDEKFYHSMQFSVRKLTIFSIEL
jgi:hypothetical protein